MFQLVSFKMRIVTSLVGQWLRLCLPMQGVWVQSLVGELRSHVSCGQKNLKINKQYCNKFNKYFKNTKKKKNYKLVMLANKTLALKIVAYCSLPHSLLLYVLPFFKYFQQDKLILFLCC